MQVKIETTPEFDVVAKCYRDIPKIVDNVADQTLKEAAFKVEGWAKYYTPVDTGRLRASIYTTVQKMYAVIQPSTNYAIYVHQGTRHMQPRPFMTQAVETLQKNNWRPLTGEMVKKLHAELKEKFYS